MRESGLVYTIVRPGGLTDGPGGIYLLEAGQGDQISGMICREDVARVCLEALELPAARNVTFEIIQTPQKGQVIWAELFNGLNPGS